MKNYEEKMHKLRVDRIMLRKLLHKINLIIVNEPTDELYRRRTAYRKRLTKLNDKISRLKEIGYEQ